MRRAWLNTLLISALVGSGMVAAPILASNQSGPSSSAHPVAGKRSAIKEGAAPRPHSPKSGSVASPAALTTQTTTVTFSVFPVGTSITTQYQPVGIDFGGD